MHKIGHQLLPTKPVDSLELRAMEMNVYSKYYLEADIEM